jgi:hypothetical protein
MQVLSITKLHDCTSVEIGYEESLVPVLPAELKAAQPAIQLIQSLMPTTKRVTKATLCLSDEEYEILQKPTVGDEVELNVSPDGVVTIRFIKR